MPQFDISHALDGIEQVFPEAQVTHTATGPVLTDLFNNEPPDDEKLTPPFTVYDFLDVIPIIGTAARLGDSAVQGLSGNGDKSVDQLKGAGINLAGDALGAVTAGLGKFVFSGARLGTKVALKAVEKGTIKAAEEGEHIAQQALKTEAKQTEKSLEKETERDLANKAENDALASKSKLDRARTLTNEEKKQAEKKINKAKNKRELERKNKERKRKEEKKKKKEDREGPDASDALDLLPFLLPAPTDPAYDEPMRKRRKHHHEHRHTSGPLDRKAPVPESNVDLPAVVQHVKPVVTYDYNMIFLMFAVAAGGIFLIISEFQK